MNSIRNYLSLIYSNPLLIQPEDGLIKVVTAEDELISWERNNNTSLGILVQDRYITVIRDLVVFPDGAIRPYNRIINSAAFSNGAMGAAILPFINNKIVLIRIFRHPIRKWSIEIPRGFGEPNLSPLGLAKKEITEEIGGNINKLIELGVMHNNTGLEGNMVNLFFAELKDMQGPQTNEGITDLLLVDFAQFEKMISDNEITDGFTLAAYARAKVRGLL